MRRFYHQLFLVVALLMSTTLAFGQASENYTGGLKVKMNEDGSKYIRFITWHQMWATFSQGDDGLQSDFLLRRSRFLAFAQISERLLILTHFGLNNMGPNQMGTAGTVPSASGNGQFFMHDAWVEYSLVPKKLEVGGGLHYWNGISRMNNQSTLNFLTLDNALHNWANLGTSDQFARHLGFYAKGTLGRLAYRVSVNEAIGNPLLGGNLASIAGTDSTEVVTNKAIYRQPNTNTGGGGKVYAGYFSYQLLDKEGMTLPYYVGTYLGKKKVFNIGAGFFYHQDGAFYYTDTSGSFERVSPLSFAVDAFLDMPIGDTGGALTAYASYTNHNWGPNLTGGLDGVGTGNIVYAHAGYLIPGTSIQPYLQFTNRSLEAHESFAAPSSSRIGVGANYYFEGNNAKISAEIQRSRDQGNASRPDANSIFRLQAMIYL